MDKNKIKHFNIRVYALITNNQKEILISDAFYNDMKMTKFPGGGLHFGEGTIDCLKREAIEESGQEIEVTGHCYTTDYFQQALFFDDHQLISIYYTVRFKEAPKFKISNTPFDFDLKNGRFSFRWIKLDDLRPNMMTFPIDRKVVEMLKTL
jgi:ADP-ribose pyrophosphatase YjhB (NUDIX family)